MSTSSRIGMTPKPVRCWPIALVAVILATPVGSALAQGFRLPQIGGGFGGGRQQQMQPQRPQMFQPQSGFLQQQSGYLQPRMQQPVYQQQAGMSQQVQTNQLPRNRFLGGRTPQNRPGINALTGQNGVLPQQTVTNQLPFVGSRQNHQVFTPNQAVLQPNAVVQQGAGFTQGGGYRQPGLVQNRLPKNRPGKVIGMPGTNPPSGGGGNPGHGHHPGHQNDHQFDQLAAYLIAGGLAGAAAGGLGYSTPSYYVSQPVASPVYTPAPTTVVVADGTAPVVTDVSQTAPAPIGAGADGSPEVVAENTQPTGSDPIAIPADPAQQTDSAPLDSSERPAASEENNKVVLMNDPDSGGEVSYNLSGFAYTIQPGNLQTLTTRPSWVIAFDRGGDFGQARYTLTKGTYTFSPTEKGWELVETKFVVTLDNSRNDADFHFLRNGQPETVKAGQTLAVSDNYPHQIVFDRGDGGKPGRRILEHGLYSIGIEEKSGLFDIVPSGKTQAAEASPAPAEAPPPAPPSQP